MTPLRYTTINSNPQHITTLKHLTLASQNISRDSASVSPSNSLWGKITSLSRSRPEENDFQSNAQVDCLPSVGPSFPGLGIRFADSLNSAKLYGENPTNPPYHQIDVFNQVGDQLSDYLQFPEPYFPPRIWSPLPSLSYPNSTNNIPTQATSSKVDERNRSSCDEDSNDFATWSLDSFAAASGLSTQALAEQLSSTADLALRYIAEENQQSLSSLLNIELSNDTSVNDDCRPNWPLLPPYKTDGPTTVETSGNSIAALVEPALGVNPVDIMGDVLYESDRSRLSFTLSSSMSMSSLENCPPPAHSSKRRVLVSHEVLTDIRVDPENTRLPSIIKNASDHASQAPAADSDSNKENSDYEQPPQDPSSRSSSPFPSPRAKKRVSKKRRSRYLTSKVPLLKDIIPAFKPAVVKVEGSVDINLGTPVFDAHKGISLEELKAKAGRYRMRNPGLSYDNRWLVSFAGKLSQQGELINEFRCYVMGCTQINKRRDHILIHLGGHLDQRPFECSFCPTRFLRKNECKRHELSHSGNRPFLCEICPAGTAFVRQDLLRRHITRTHGGVRRKT